MMTEQRPESPPTGTTDDVAAYLDWLLSDQDSAEEE